jgi:hypothetical protein
MRLVFKHGSLMETSERNQLACRNKQNHKSDIERIITRSSGMRRRSWKQHKKKHHIHSSYPETLSTKHLPPDNVKDVIERDTLRKTIGNYTLTSAPNISKRRKRKNWYQWLLRNDPKVDRTSKYGGKINCNNLQKEVELVGCSHKEENEMTSLFCIKIYMKQSKVDCLFDLGS